MNKISTFFLLFLVTLNLRMVQAPPELSTLPECIFSGVKGTLSAPKPITVLNTGNESLLITSLLISGTNASSFVLENSSALPLNIGPGQTDTVRVRFKPGSTTIGMLKAQLNISSNDSDEPNIIVGLYGLSASGEQGNLEPPLNAVVKTLGYNINVGGTSLILSTDTLAIGDEVLKPLFQKAGPGPVTMKPVGRYSPDDLLPFGYYTNKNGILKLNELGKVALDQEQTLLPELEPGSTINFEPGSDVFGFYAGVTSYAAQNTYTEDKLNTGPLRHSVRIYPIKNRSGVLLPNRYMLAFEPAKNGDYQDYVFEVTNVKPANVPTPPGILEAESAILERTVIASNWAGFTGKGFVDYINPSGDFIEWTINKPNAGPGTVKFRYANGGTTNRPLKLEVNGIVRNANLAFQPTGPWTNWSTSSIVAVDLIPGINKIRLTSTGSSGSNIDHLEWADLSGANEGISEAELASINRAKVQSNQAGFTGTGFVDFINNTEDYIEWTINSSASIFAQMKFRYANGSASNRPLKLEVNGQTVHSNLDFHSTGTWINWSFLTDTLNLIPGENKIRLTAIGFSGPNIDHIDWKQIDPVTNSASTFEQRNESGNQKISISPNPASSIARIQLNRSSIIPSEITLSDISGKIHFKISGKIGDADYYDIPVGNLRAGVYFLIIRSGIKTYSSRLFVAQK